MQCPDCGYMLTAFEKDCPRCEKMGKPLRPVPGRSPAYPSADLPAAGQDGSLMATHAAGRGAAIAIISVALILIGIAIVFILMRAAAPGSRMKSGAGTSGSRIKEAGNSSMVKAIISAAKDGAYRRYGIPGSAVSRQSLERQLTRCSTSITRYGNRRAEVKFFLRTGALLDKEDVKRDRSGKWQSAALLKSL